jgi:ABC-type uncharacterized transport system auxiliary subunit
MKIIHLLLAAIIPFLSACAFSTTDVPINYSYKGEASTKTSMRNVNLKVVGIKDIQGVENPQLLLRKRNAYGTTSGGYQAEKAVSLIVEDALVQGFKAAGLDRTGAKNISISGEVMHSGIGIIQTGWTTGVTKFAITVKLTAKDRNKIIWRDTITGLFSRKETAPIRQAFSSALDNLVDTLLDDEYFRSKVLK